VFNGEILDHPCNEVVFESPFDNLVEEIGGEHLVDVRTRKVIGEWLK